MANIVRKPNGTYLIRISAGKDDRGKPVTVSRTFAPERNEPFYRKSSGADFERRNSGCERAENRTKLSRKTLFRDFCEKFLEIKASEIAPGTLAFYRQIIQTHLIPTYGMMRT